MATSFRDPAGHVLQVNGRVLRFVNPTGESDLRAFLNSPLAVRLSDAGSLVKTRVLPEAELSQNELLLNQSEATLVLEHEPVPFKSFHYEWPPEMLHAAADVTLTLAQSLLNEGFGLKDATPYNVLFHGPRPVFVDWLSFEQRDPCDPTWLAYAQFVRTFLLPLLVNKNFHLPLDQMLLANRDGLEPEQVYRMCGPVRRMLPPFLTLVSLPSWLAANKNGKTSGTYAPRRVESRAKAHFIMDHLFKGLRRKLRSVEPAKADRSAWSDYMSRNRYTDDYFPLKQSFVETAFADCRPSRVLDVGCNTGYFSELAAKTGASVVAIDSDPIVVGRLWRRAKAESLDILPLVVNLARPTPSTGWVNDECSSFLDRSRGAFDLVLMLAVVHHMLVSERIPLSSILSLASELTSRFLVIEYVPPDDPKFRQIARGRDHLHQELTKETFELECQTFFETIRSTRLGETGRWLYLLQKRS
jgi:SAM-dependent methyltransferase